MNSLLKWRQNIQKNMVNNKIKPFKDKNNAFLFNRKALIFSTSISVFSFVWYFIALAIFFNTNGAKPISIITMIITVLILLSTFIIMGITTYLNQEITKWWKYAWFWFLDLLVFIIYIIMIVASNNHGDNDLMKILYFEGYNYMVFSVLLSVMSILNTLIIFYMYVKLRDDYGK